MQASPHMLTACADTSRENGDGARKRGSVVAILGAECTPGSSRFPAGPAPRLHRLGEQLVAPGTAIARLGTMGRWLRGPRELAEPRIAGPGRGPTPTDDDDLASTRDPGRFLNRELSWLDFNARVLALAEDPKLPLLERAKFLAIFSAEPRRVLPGARRRASRSSSTPASARPPPTASTPSSSSAPSAPTPTSCAAPGARRSRKEIAPALEDAGIRFATGTTSTDDDRSELGDGVRRPDLPGAHAARRRPRAPVPVHLEPVAEPRGHGPRPATRRASGSPA